MPTFRPVAPEVEAYESSQGMVVVRPDAAIALIPVHIFGMLFEPTAAPKALPAPRPAKTGGRKKAARRKAVRAKAPEAPRSRPAKKQTTAAELAEIARRARRGETPATIAGALGLNYHTVWSQVKRVLATVPTKVPKSERSTEAPPHAGYRCPECGSRTPTKPCTHCGTEW